MFRELNDLINNLYRHNKCFLCYYSVTSLLNIIQTFLNEKSLYDVVVNLPVSKAFLPLVTTIATHSKFKYIECKFKIILKVQ